MSGLCDLAVVFGLTFGGHCQPATPAPDPMPADEPAAWSYKEAKPEPPKEPPKSPNFPPVVVEKTVIREVPVPASQPTHAPTPKPVVKQPSAIELAVRASYRSRSTEATTWGEVERPASLPPIGPAATVKSIPVPKIPARPLDLAAVVNSQHKSEYQAEGLDSSYPVDNSRMVGADRIITAIFENGINSQLDGSKGGPVVLQVSRNVFGYHGRNILIPKGSRLICGYVSPQKIGDSRANMRCSRILLGGHRAEIFGLKANVTDMQGYLGVTGEVDTRFLERFGTAFALAGISAVVRGAASASSGAESLANRSDMFTTGSEELAQQLGQVGATALEQTVALSPRLKVRQGTRIQIRPVYDWYIAPVPTATAKE